MTKDVLIAIKGLQFEEAEDAEEIEVIQRGQYYQRNGSHYLMYEEPIEGTNDTIINRIKFKENEVQVTKKGAVNTMLSFRENEKNMTNYATPFGNLVMGIHTHQIDLNIQEEKILVHVDYALDVNYEFLADCKITITVTAL
jgi:uncharacterized beta-barrel protein YwiB (DUF1934 family)